MRTPPVHLCTCRARNPILLSKGRNRDFSDNDHGQALELFDDVVLEERSVTLPPGSRIVLYTDGATDAVNPDNERYGRNAYGNP